MYRFIDFISIVRNKNMNWINEIGSQNPVNFEEISYTIFQVS